MGNGDSHRDAVDAWAARFASDLTSQRVIDAFDEAFHRLWQRARQTLGDITLTAISNRVLYTAAQRFPVLEPVSTDAGGLQLDALRAQVDGLDSAEVLEAARFVLIEFLTVLGKLVAEILTPALHAELAQIAVADPAAREDEAYEKDDEP